MRVSVVIPTLNEETTIAGTVRRLRSERASQIIVVDGGSQDGTVARASASDLVLHGPRGRAAQMNLGASHAEGEALLFLHADCRLESGALSAISRILVRRHVVAGCFRMQVLATGWQYRLIDAAATARVRLTGIVYGDQGLFLRREEFAAAGGFPPVSFMEDVLLGLALRRRGRVQVAHNRIAVSPRRWQRHGILRQTLRNWALTALAAAGAHPDRLKRFYPEVR